MKTRLLLWAETIGRFLRRLIGFPARVAAKLLLMVRGGAVILFYDLLWRELLLRRYLGYGERPVRVLFIAILVFSASAVAYWLAGSFVVDPNVSPPITGRPEIQDAIYYSLVSFVALGYGSWTPQPVNWAQWAGAIESVLGVFSVVFFSITFAQRITR